jgi:hypothetical protein
MRTTSQPWDRSSLVTFRSRCFVLSSLVSHHPVRVAGILQWLGRGHECQKHPSTNTAIFCKGKTKSGFPKTFQFRRQPEMPCCLNSVASRSSVDRFLEPRIFDITSDRFSGEKTSVITITQSSSATISAICFARNGGTALPTCLYCSVLGPSKK